MNIVSPDELPNRAFQLAYFIHRERKTAVEIATRALNKLQLAATAQGKRLYYRLTGRAEARKARSKVSMGEPQLLQRLVYVESEEFERRKETAAQNPHVDDGAMPARQSDLLIYFIKHLVRITTRRNSFYVTLGVGRLLYNYTTPETMDLYNLVIQDPDRVHDDYYYRSRKGVLLKELKERFGGLIEIVKGPRGEQRWRASDEKPNHRELVSECLRWFTPWATSCVVPERFDPLSEPINELNFQGHHPDEEHEVEVNRIHAALHPDCFARLAAASGLAAPDERLELPYFFLANGDDDSDGDSRTPPHLSEEELSTINNLLAREASRRKAASSGFLRVLVDGTEVAEINIAHFAVAQFAVDETAEVIDVYGADQSGPLLMATHLLEAGGSGSRSFSVTIEGGQTISFAVNALRDDEGSAAGARVAVTFEDAISRKASSTARRLWNSIVGESELKNWWKPVAAFGALALLLTVGWLVWVKREGQNNLVHLTPTPAPTLAMPSPAAPEIVRPRDHANEPPIPKPKNLEVVPAPLIGRRAKEGTDVRRTFVPDSPVSNQSDDAGTRGWNRDLMGKPLAEIQQLYLQPVGVNAANDSLINELRASFEEKGALQLADAGAADAALKTSVTKSNAAGSNVVVLVRAVNANGYVIWPAGRRGGSWRYVGARSNVAARIVRDLTAEIERARR
jgi:hypothetical protein